MADKRSASVPRRHKKNNNLLMILILWSRLAFFRARENPMGERFRPASRRSIPIRKLHQVSVFFAPAKNFVLSNGERFRLRLNLVSDSETFRRLDRVFSRPRKFGPVVKGRDSGC